MKGAHHAGNPEDDADMAELDALLDGGALGDKGPGGDVARKGKGKNANHGKGGTEFTWFRMRCREEGVRVAELALAALLLAVGASVAIAAAVRVGGAWRGLSAPTPPPTHPMASIQHHNSGPFGG